jgi:hypothetical protein
LELELKDNVAIVTGGSRAIGNAIAINGDSIAAGGGISGAIYC